MIPYILREPNTIFVLLFICKYFGLSLNACIVDKIEEAICIFPLLT
jgi:hypothetical protein